MSVKEANGSYHWCVNITVTYGLADVDFEAEWRIYTSVNWATVGSDNGLSRNRRQVNIWTNAGLLFSVHLETNFSEIWIKMQQFSFKEINFQCRMKNGGHFLCADLNVLKYVIGKPWSGPCHGLMITDHSFWLGNWSRPYAYWHQTICYILVTLSQSALYLLFCLFHWSVISDSFIDSPTLYSINCM